MSANHTEGTWTAHAQASANNYIILKDNNWVAAIQFNGEMMVAKQDELAKVIAAAPELLEALTLMLYDADGKEWKDSELTDGEWDIRVSEGKAKARAAIAKAVQS